MAESGETLTYLQLEQGSARLARYLASRGLRHGDHIALLTDNQPKAFEVYWAALRSGLYITAVNSHLSRDEISYILTDSGARALIAAAHLGDVVADLGASTPDIEIRLSSGGRVDGFLSYEDEVAEVSPRPLEIQPRGADMLYSSGTTGRPKGIKPDLPNREVHEPGDTYVELFGPAYDFGPETVYLSPAPIYHAAPLRFGGVVHALGGTVVMMERFDAARALSVIER
ncbi:3-oxocholest-4-en-26-oate--CoA ligase [Rhodococcus sp. B50]|nr:3-oxocholest-4-en-26-oate--CoA ligase [Rhodococcus sp. B50]